MLRLRVAIGAVCRIIDSSVTGRHTTWQAPNSNRNVCFAANAANIEADSACYKSADCILSVNILKTFLLGRYRPKQRILDVRSAYFMGCESTRFGGVRYGAAPASVNPDNPDTGSSSFATFPLMCEE